MCRPAEGTQYRSSLSNEHSSQRQNLTPLTSTPFLTDAAREQRRAGDARLYKRTRRRARRAGVSNILADSRWRRRRHLRRSRNPGLYGYRSNSLLLRAPHNVDYLAWRLFSPEGRRGDSIAQNPLEAASKLIGGRCYEAELICHMYKTFGTKSLPNIAREVFLLLF